MPGQLVLLSRPDASVVAAAPRPGCTLKSLTQQW